MVFSKPYPKYFRPPTLRTIYITSLPPDSPHSLPPHPLPTAIYTITVKGIPIFEEVYAFCCRLVFGFIALSHLAEAGYTERRNTQRERERDKDRKNI